MWFVKVEFFNTDTGETEKWTCARRYREFNAFHVKLKDQYSSAVSGVSKACVGSHLTLFRPPFPATEACI